MHNYVEKTRWIQSWANRSSSQASAWGYSMRRRTRLIVVPRSTPYYPEEAGNGFDCGLGSQPRTSSLRDARLTIRSDGRSTRDNWRSADKEKLEDPWAGRCTFYDRWTEASNVQEADVAAVAKQRGLGDLVFHEEHAFNP